VFNAPILGTFEMTEFLVLMSVLLIMILIFVLLGCVMDCFAIIIMFSQIALFLPSKM
jgi:TRAP-type C4-dicarboxylate transport system permease large subunit